MLQNHLLRADLYRELSKLNVNQEHPWDQRYPPPFTHYQEITDSTWYKNAIEKYIKDYTVNLPTFQQDNTSEAQDAFVKFVITLELYTDSTGTDQKESLVLSQ
jgi:hypothetical protein